VNLWPIRVIRPAGFRPMPHTFPAAGTPNSLVGRTPWSARDALVPPVREESVGCDHREADQGGSCGRGRPPQYLCYCLETGKTWGVGLQPALREPCKTHGGRTLCATKFFISLRAATNLPLPPPRNPPGHGQGQHSKADSRLSPDPRPIRRRSPYRHGAAGAKEPTAKPKATNGCFGQRIHWLAP
jgi:hypothetical protein